MSWGVVAGVGGGLISGVMGAGAAGDAADAQVAASDRASATQEAARVQQRADLMPWMSGGQQANNALLYRLGLGGSANGGSAPVMQTADQLRATLLPRFTSGTAGQRQGDAPPLYAEDLAQWQMNGGAGGVIPGTSTQQIDEAGLSAEIQRQMAAQEAQRAQFQSQASSDPSYGSLLRKFDQNDLNSDLVFQNTYKTAMDTGLNAINSRAANSGGYGSGAALKALTRFGAQTANAYTGDAYNRNMGEKNQTYNFLGGVSQQGQSAAAGVGAAGISTANGIAGNQLAAGNAQSAGMVGGANALSGGIADATNAYRWNQLINKPKPTANTGWGSGSLYGNQDLGSYL